jgi:hypothetical protein
MTQKAIDDVLRAQYMEDLRAFLEQKYDCDVCQTATGSLMIPTIDAAGEERWIKFSVIVPKSAAEDAGTDGYSLAREYQLKLDAAKERKARKAAKAKAKKE